MTSAAPTVQRLRESPLKPAPQGLLKEFGAPEPPSAWFAAKAAQIRLMQVQRRAATIVPASLAFLIGIGAGSAPVPMTAKYVAGGMAATLIAWAVAASKIQARRTDEMFRRAAPDEIKIVEE